jgi:hypothetical protein
MHSILTGHALILKVAGLHLEVDAHAKLSTVGPE